MTHLKEILNPIELADEVWAGNVRKQQHPNFPELFIYNYTEQCAYNRHWTDVTRATRGLIVRSDGEVLARPFPKFFNWDEKEAPRILDDQVVWHWDNKYDGSLGILYIEPSGRPAIATRGSFASEQALLGTKILHGSGRAWQLAEYIDAGYTPLFEICGPDNRIVLRYEENFLQPLGYMHIQTGQFVPPEGAYKPRTMRDLLGNLSRQDAEGWVVWISTYKAVKIKQADYIALHRLVTGLSKKEVWRQLRAGTYAGYVAQLPDEIQKEAEVWADELREEFSEIHARAAHTHAALLRVVPTGRREQAAWIKDVAGPESGLVFSLLDGKDITDSIWRMLEPSGVTA